MSHDSVVHETFVVDRLFDATPERVFAAYSDVELRSKWGIPSDDEVIVYSESSFCVGGVDVYRCGPKTDPKYRGHVQYQDIVPSRRVVYVERVSLGDAPMAASLVTMELSPDHAGTRLVLTDQIASFVGPEMIQGAKHGTEAALHNLAQHLSATTADAERSEVGTR